MGEDDSGFKVADRRLFTADGELREATADSSSSSQDRSSAEPASFFPAPDPEMPMTFQTLIFTLSTTALLQLGLAPDPASGKPEKDLPAAKQTIDILEILREKTQGNLSSEEAHLLEDCLYDLKMSYVRIAQGGKV
ncbi:MAG TPA: DUF1844 domain-containing protein [Terriglobia bacterium]|jgi:hypothetical protein|nr:DUF1844 domain-containing protein [Terriglobia bacterium]